MTNAIDREALVRRFADDSTLALLLVGSHARGEASPTSDVDLSRHVAAADRHGDLACHVDGAGRLVTVKTFHAEREALALARPGEAVWQVPTMRHAVILFDRDGGAARLLAAARAFSWEPLAEACDRHVAGEVAHMAEEALKIAGGLGAGRPSQVLYGAMGLVTGLAEATIVHRRGFIVSENLLLDGALAAMAGHTSWQAAFRTAAGYDAAPPEDRGKAALALYAATVELVDPLFDTEQRAVAGTALAAAHQMSCSGLSGASML